MFLLSVTKITGISDTFTQPKFFMKKVTKKVILNSTKQTLNDLIEHFQLEQTKKTQRVVETLSKKFAGVLKNEIAKQAKKKLKSAKSELKSKKKKKVIPVQ